jgi:uncharacterized membrane protein YtjA (UPF0391 family)
MLRAAIGFFVLGLIAMVLGAGNVAGISIELGRTLLVFFVLLALVSFGISLITGKSPRTLP